MGANNSTEEDPEDERQPDNTTFKMTYTTGDPLSGMKSYSDKHMNLWELLELVSSKYVSHVHIVKIQWLPNIKIDFQCLSENFGEEDNFNIVFNHIILSSPNDNRRVKFSVSREFPDIIYNVKKSTFTVKGQLYEDGMLPEPFDLLVMQSGQLIKSAAKV